MGSPGLSMINYLDALNAWQLVREVHAASGSPAATSFKHVSPTGAAIAGAVDATMCENWGLGDAPVGPLASAYRARRRGVGRPAGAGRFRRDHRTRLCPRRRSDAEPQEEWTIPDPAGRPGLRTSTVGMP
ncbi:hypothetical protein FZI93_07480 [Mycobacterium sp. CBMA361]|nr:hypothetical protein [Mycolicibacterium sp. CBMA 361]